MKVLFVVDTYPPNVNGAALATENLVKELDKRGHTVTVVAPATSFTDSKRKEGNITVYRLKSIPILIEKVQEFRISPRPLHAAQIEEIIEEVKPDIIHINEPWLLGMSATEIAKERHIPIILSHHFMPENLVHYLHLPEKLEQVVNRTMWHWYGGMCKNFDLVICPSETAKDLLNAHSEGVALKVISNGIDLGKFTPHNDGAYLRQRYALPEKPTVLFVGRLDKEKNIDVLIRAIARIKDTVDFQTVIIGQGKEKQALEALATELGILGKISFTDYLPKKDLPNVYTIADIFVMPSIAELQSLVTMEAMATGLPIVAADAIALPHLVHDGQNGFLFAPGNDQDLAEKLLVLLQDKELRKKMGKESLQLIQAHDSEKVITEFENTYKHVIANYKYSHYDNTPRKREMIKTLKKINIKKFITSQATA